MLAKVEPKVLKDVVSTLKSILSKKSALPIFQSYHIEAKGDRLVLKATNLNEFLTYYIPANVVKEGAVCVDGAKFTDIVKDLENELVLGRDKDKLIVQSSRTTFKLNTMDEENFIEFPEVGQDKSFNIHKDIFAKSIDKVEYAVAKDDTRIALNSVCVHSVDSSYLHIVASDGHRLALCRYNFDNVGSWSMLLPKSSLKTLKALLDDVEGEITIQQSENLVKLSTFNWEFIVRQGEGEYPDYLSVLNSTTENAKYTITVEKEPLLKSLKKASKVGLMVALTFSYDQVGIQVKDPENGEFHDVVIEIEDHNLEREDKVKVGFNVKYLMDALDSFDVYKVKFGIIDDDSPVLIASYDEDLDNYKAIVMPVRL